MKKDYHMQKFFEKFKDKSKDEMVINFKVDAQLDGSITKKTTRDIPFKCSSINDFEKTYNDMEFLLPNHPEEYDHFKVRIEINGTLNGNKINMKFNNLNSYRQFLEAHSLMTRKLNNSQ